VRFERAEGRLNETAYWSCWARPRRHGFRVAALLHFLREDSVSIERAQVDIRSDRPVKSGEDQLGRLPFAKRVAKEICAWRIKNDSLVISLNGDWGSGKTSLKDFILECITAECVGSKLKPPAVVEFNPWQWSGQDRLLEAFFDEVGAVFRADKIGNRITAEKLARLWEGVKVVSSATREVATHAKNVFTAGAAILAGGSGVLSAILTNPTAKGILAGASVVFLMLGPFA